MINKSQDVVEAAQDSIAETEERENLEHYGPGYDPDLILSNGSKETEQEIPIGLGVTEHLQESDVSVTENNAIANEN